MSLELVIEILLSVVFFLFFWIGLMTVMFMLLPGLKKEHKKHLVIYLVALIILTFAPPDPFAQIISTSICVVSTFVLGLFLRSKNEKIANNRILITCVLFVLTLSLDGFGAIRAWTRMFARWILPQ
jgi:hypothetical protein